MLVRMDFIESTGVTAMPNSSSIANRPTRDAQPQATTTQPVTSTVNQTPDKLNKAVFQALLVLILLAFSALFMMILMKLPGAF